MLGIAESGQFLRLLNPPLPLNSLAKMHSGGNRAHLRIAPICNLAEPVDTQAIQHALQLGPHPIDRFEIIDDGWPVRKHWPHLGVRNQALFQSGSSLESSPPGSLRPPPRAFLVQLRGLSNPLPPVDLVGGNPSFLARARTFASDHQATWRKL